MGRIGLAQPLQRVSSFTGTRHHEVAKQMLSQRSYTPTVVYILLIVKHLEPLENGENLKFISGFSSCVDGGVLIKRARRRPANEVPDQM